MKSTFTLYGTSGCHLCDMANSIILPLAQTYGLAIKNIDIAGNEALEATYATKIPVLSDGIRELAWPFDHITINRFLCCKNQFEEP